MNTPNRKTLVLAVLGIVAASAWGCGRSSHVVGEVDGSARSGGGAAGTGGVGGRGGSGGAIDAGTGDAIATCNGNVPVGQSRPANDGCNTCVCVGQDAWVCSTAFCQQDAAATAGTGGGAGGRGGTGGGGGAAGSGRGGGGGSAGAGGAGGNACQEATMLDRSCTTDADCVAVQHTMNCCGGQQWIGIRSSQLQRFTTLEDQCRAGYPACGCFDGRNGADDGSRIPDLVKAGVTCQNNRCTTYAPACTHPCPTGQACLSCATGVTAICSPICSTELQCEGDFLARCLQGYSTSLCAPQVAACDSPN